MKLKRTSLISAAAVVLVLAAPTLPAGAETVPQFVVSGTILDPSGHPVAGVDVGLEYGGSARPTASDDPDEALATSDAAGAFSFGVYSTTVANGAWVWLGSANGGSFVPATGGVVRQDASATANRFTEVVIGHHGVRASHWQQVPRLIGDEFAAGALQGLTVTVPRTGSISGHQSTLAGAQVNLLDLSGGVVATTRAARATGAYVFSGLTSGGYRIAVSRVGTYLGTTSKSIELQPGDGVVYSPKLQRGATLAIHLTWGSRRLKEKAVLTVEHAGELIAQARTSSAGTVAFRGLERGSYRVTTSPSAKLAAVTHSVSVRAFGATVRAAFRVKRAATIAGTISAKSGRAQVSVVSSAGAVVARAAVATGHRTYRLHGLTSGWYSLVVTRGRHVAQAKLHLHGGRTTRVRSYPTRKPVVLRGTAVGATSGSVVLTSGVRTWTTRIGATGSFTLTDLPPAVYTATTNVAGHIAKTTTVTIRRSTRRVLHIGAATGSITGVMKVSGSVLSYASVTLVGPTATTVTTGSDGTFVASGLAPGRYTIGRIVSADPIAPYWLTANARLDVVAGKSFTVGALAAEIQGD